MEFQIYDYVEDHEKQEEEELSDSEEKQELVLPEYIIHVFGRTLDDKSVYCKIQNFTPHFYIKLPSKWTKSDAKSKIKIMEKWFHSYDNKKVWKKFRAGLQSMDLVVRKEAIGFTNDKDFLFARMVFTNSILSGLLCDYWIMKTKHTSSIVEIIGITGGILKIFSLINHSTGIVTLKLIKYSIKSRISSMDYDNETAEEL